MPDGGKGKRIKVSHVGDRLRSFLEHVERLEEEKRALQSDIAEVKREVTSAGFDLKVFNAVLRERRMARAERHEFQALLDIYRAAVGDLDGTPLGEHARIRLMQMDLPPPKLDGDGSDPAAAAGKPPGSIVSDDELSGAEAAAAEPEAPPVDLETARADGAKAAAANVKVIANPWPAGDERRAAWDEGWCSHAGNDGMEIPAAWRRTKK